MSHLDCWYYVAYEDQYIMSSLEKRLATIICDRFSDSESDSESDSSIGSSFPGSQSPSDAPTPLARHSTGMFPSLFQSRNEPQHKYSREPPPTPPPRQPPKLTRKDTPRYSYDKVMFEVRNMQVLSPQQMMYVRTLPKDKILELLDIYNQIMVNVNEVFS